MVRPVSSKAGQSDMSRKVREVAGWVRDLDTGMLEIMGHPATKDVFISGQPLSGQKRIKIHCSSLDYSVFKHKVKCIK